MRAHLQHKVGSSHSGEWAKAAAKVLTVLLAAAVACGLPNLAHPLCAQGSGGSEHRKSTAVEATRAELRGDSGGTTFTLRLSSGVRAEVFTLADPYRVVVDLPDVRFQLPDGIGQKQHGLVNEFRYGQLSEGKARIVMDTRGPVVIKKAGMTQQRGGGVELAIELGPTSVSSFGAGTGSARTAEAPSTPPVPERSIVKQNRSKPVVVIDAGHGGIDPGAMGPSNLKEKTVVLAVAKALEAQLKASKRYEVRLTRKTDVFIPLDERLKLSRELEADLFISLHADAIGQKSIANSVRGATIYTLSERASDEEARRMAEKENNSDAIAGLQTASFEEVGDVRDILIDLLKRETANFSADFSNILVKRLGSSTSLSSRPQRSAAFKVLRQADTPSVLVELGYMSNPNDEKLLNSAAWQKKVAASIGSAVDSYFSKRTAKAP